MRIAFAGASGTGKTTLAEYVAKSRGLTTCPVGARSVAKAMGFDNPYDVDRAGRRSEFQRRVFEEKRAWEAEHEDFVTDRTVFDCLAYLLIEGGARSLRDGEVDEYAEAFERYDAVFLVPSVLFQDLSDPVRVQQRGYHEAHEAVVFGMAHNAVSVSTYRRRWPRIHTITQRALDDRESQVDRVLIPF